MDKEFKFLLYKAEQEDIEEVVVVAKIAIPTKHGAILDKAQ